MLSCGVNQPTISAEFHEQTTKGNAYEYHYKKNQKHYAHASDQRYGKSRLSNILLTSSLDYKAKAIMFYHWPSQDLMGEKAKPQMIGADAILYIHIHDAVNLDGETCLG